MWNCSKAHPFLSQEIYKDRKKFSEQVFKVASSDLVNMGISVVSYTLKDVHDDHVRGSSLKPNLHKNDQRWFKCSGCVMVYIKLVSILYIYLYFFGLLKHV